MSLQLKRLLVDRSGVSAVEAALLLPIFGLFVGGIAETAAMMTTMRSLDFGVEQASRLVRVNTNTAASAQAFKEAICSKTVTIGNCTENLTVQVASASTIPQLARALANLSPNQSFNPGSRLDYVAVVATYNWKPTFFPDLSVFGGQRMKLTIRTAFRNEPQ